MIKWEHDGQLRYSPEVIQFTSDVLIDLGYFMQQHPNVPIETLTRTSSYVMVLRCEGEELLLEHFTKLGYEVKIAYLRVEIYPKQA